MVFSSQQVGDLMDTSIHDSHEAIIDAVLSCNWREFESRCEIHGIDVLVVFIPAAHQAKAGEIADFFFAALSANNGAEYAFSKVSITVEDVEKRIREDLD